MDILNTLTEKQQLSIYNNYRAQMKSFNRLRKATNVGYPAYWRNLARKQCVERYNVSFAQVKAIVQKFDAVNGITHEKQPDQRNRYAGVPLDSRYNGVYPQSAMLTR